MNALFVVFLAVVCSVSAQNALLGPEAAALKETYHNALESALKALPNACGASTDPTEMQICPTDLRPECVPVFAAASKPENLSKRQLCKDVFSATEARGCKTKCILTVTGSVVEGLPNTNGIQGAAAQLKNPVITELANKFKGCSDHALRVNYFNDATCEVFGWYGKCILKSILQVCKKQ